MPFTPNFAWPYQSLADPPNGAALGETGFTAADATVATLKARVDLIEPAVIMRRIERNTSSSTTTTTEIGVLRGDGLSCVAGRAYRFSFQGRVASSVNGDGITTRLRLQTDGSNASITSTEVAQDPVQTLTGVGAGGSVLSYLHCPGSNQTVSVLLSVQRSQGTGNVQIVTTNSLIQVVVEDIGPAPATSGTAL